MERRAGKARAIAVSADAAAADIARQVLLASGISLTTLLALLLMRP
jgi:hypothetical protein